MLAVFSEHPPTFPCCESCPVPPNSGSLDLLYLAKDSKQSGKQSRKNIMMTNVTKQKMYTTPYLCLRPLQRDSSLLFKICQMSPIKKQQNKQLPQQHQSDEYRRAEVKHLVNEANKFTFKTGINHSTAKGDCEISQNKTAFPAFWSRAGPPGTGCSK